LLTAGFDDCEHLILAFDATPRQPSGLWAGFFQSFQTDARKRANSENGESANRDRSAPSAVDKVQETPEVKGFRAVSPQIGPLTAA
jgi:hypothetical protein